MSDWIRVKPADHCPVCDHDTWCTYNDEVCICMRVPNEHPKQFKDGSVGYIHRLIDEPRKQFVPRRHEEPKPAINAEAMMKAWASKMRPGWLIGLSEELGVRVSALMELRCAWAAKHSAWAFPMRDGLNNVVGIRLRNQKGDKWAVKGSKQGIFLPLCIPQKQAWICEGPTDTAAALSLGLFAIGRPSCSGGLFDLLTALKRLQVREAVIIADNDDPGISGAETLAIHLEIPCCIMTLPCKDVRAFVNNGGTVEMLENIAKQMRTICPKN